MCLVFAVPFSVFYSKRVSIHIQDLKVLEPSLFFRLSSKVSNDFLKGGDFVVSDGENVEFGAAVEPIDA